MAAPKSDYAPGSGLTPQPAEPGNRLLVYADLKAMRPYADYRAPDRTIEFRLTGNMERYFWSIDGKKYSEAEPIRLTYGERVRITLVNDTMMEHPIHLHGMWSDVEDEHGRFLVRKHTVTVPPGTKRSVRVTADAFIENELRTAETIVIVAPIDNPGDTRAWSVIATARVAALRALENGGARP